MHEAETGTPGLPFPALRPGAPRAVGVSAPGKLILMGEHAAVYGRPALVAAVDLRLRVALTPVATGSAETSGIELDLPQLPHREHLSWVALRDYARTAEESWQAYSRKPCLAAFQRLRGDDPAHVVKVALGEALAARPGPPPGALLLRIASDLPIGSGFGSSAATAVGVVAAFLACCSAPVEPGEIERLALEVERRQHGSPSGIDTATVVRGGLLLFRRGAKGVPAVEPLATGSPLLGSFRVYDTGTPAEPTGAVVAAVSERRERDGSRHEQIFERMEAATLALQGELLRESADPARVTGLIRDHEACLEELGVVPATVRSLIRQVEAAGGAAKISGAGSLSGPGAGSLLVYHRQPEQIAAWRFLHPFPFHPVHLGAPGFRREELE
ncbi:MAG: hypothetical protein M3O15_01465 [Acidobacteriota bacterium]|nr:hypothetical protein [Acidobacteriota bacterium]